MLQIIASLKGTFRSSLRSWIEIIIKTQIEEPLTLVKKDIQVFGTCKKLTIDDFTIYDGIGGVLYMLIYFFVKSSPKSTDSPLPSEDAMSRRRDSQCSSTMSDSNFVDTALPNAEDLSFIPIASMEYLSEKIEKCVHLIELIMEKQSLSLDNGDISGVGGMMGLFSLLSIAYDILGKTEKAKITLHNIAIHFPKLCFINRRANKPISNEWLYGRIGYLYTVLFLQRYFKDSKVLPDNYLEVMQFDKVVDIIKQDGDKGNKYMWEWHEKEYLGAVHGFCGIAKLLLDLTDIKNDESSFKKIKETVDWLVSEQFSDGNFPSSVGSKSSRLLQFCHGVTGVMPILLDMYKITKDEKYLDSAKKAGACMWKFGLLKKGLGLCHGIFGNLYPFILMYQTTGDDECLMRAIRFAQYGCENQSKLVSVPDHPFSLFEGISGSCIVLDGLIELMCNYELGVKEDYFHFPCFDYKIFKQ
ncbi:predicted protein [Naegleria gruberi]|uniref:Predicted protein n=1 Tax=Naegleria gruberi TaxID=5762 RepID=D2V6A5_NAEGR|nr:uncharacterized protein NAEGRDRAFT_64365 [Naegleria gruberi]EFC47538.1 predicted protein [Naegleria gruberi]|eukprot:XP_002680282.1 predicted protein [Naegleria gruberi strain NEG-M]